MEGYSGPKPSVEEGQANFAWRHFVGAQQSAARLCQALGELCVQSHCLEKAPSLFTKLLIAPSFLHICERHCEGW